MPRRKRYDWEWRGRLPLSRRGRPLLDANRWLEAQIRRLPDLYQYDHLYDEWIRRHHAETGEYLRDAYRSFHQAAEGCIQRILHPS